MRQGGVEDFYLEKFKSFATLECIATQRLPSTVLVSEINIFEKILMLHFSSDILKFKSPRIVF